MANVQCGEVDAGGGFVLRFSTNALVSLEGETGKTFEQLAGELQASPSAGLVARMFTAALYRDGRRATGEEAAQALDLLSLKQAGELVGKALAAAFPPEGGEGNGARAAR